MGYYIDPTNCSKEEWLNKHGVPADGNIYPNADSLAVCLVDNVMFTAAGICFSKSETEAFAHPDGRRKKWYRVSREDLKPFYKG
jgi:hypothetical protein